MGEARRVEELRPEPRRIDEVTELSLLLPTARMSALIDLGRVRGQSVAQILRGLIERELTHWEAAC